MDDVTITGTEGTSRSVHREVTVEVGHCSRLTALHLDSGTDERLAIKRRNNLAGNRLCHESTKHCLHREQCHDERNKLHNLYESKL